MERSLYESRLKAARDKYAQMKWAKKSGLAEGLAEGIFKGRAEEKEDVARNLRDMGLSILQIAKATGLSEQQIATL